MKLHFVDRDLDVDAWQALTLAAPLSDDGKSTLWDEAEPCGAAALAREPVAGAAFADLPAGALRAATYAQYGKALAAHLLPEPPADRVPLRCGEADVDSPDESEGDFRSRLALAVREQRDARKDALRRKYAPKLTAAESRVDRAGDRAKREQDQVSQQKMQTAISVGATVLGALFGRKAISAGSIGRATTAARSATRIGRESEEAQRAAESSEQAAQRHAQLVQELEAELAALDQALDPQQIELRTVSLTPRKTDIAVGAVQLLWSPWRTGADGFPASGVLSARDERPMLRSAPRWHALLLLLTLAACARNDGADTAAPPWTGDYRAALQLPGGELPFALSITEEQGRLVGWIANGDERLRIDETTVSGGELTLRMPGYENRITARQRGGQLQGELFMVKAKGKHQRIPFTALRGAPPRFFPQAAEPGGDVSGRWATTFTDDER